MRKTGKHYRLNLGLTAVVLLLTTRFTWAQGPVPTQLAGCPSSSFVPPAGPLPNGPVQTIPAAYSAAGAAPAVPGDPQFNAQQEIEELQKRLASLENQLHGVGTGPLYDQTPPGVEPTRANLAGGLQAVPMPPGAFPDTSPPPPGSVPLITTPTIHIGAKAILDNVQFNQSPANRKVVGSEEDITGFRFLRLMFYGDLYENIDYRFELDMAQAVSSSNPSLLTAFQDVWINFRELPWLGHLKVGYFKEPISMEAQTGEEYLFFMERALGISAIAPLRRMGVMAYNDINEDKTTSWFLGTFREGSGDKNFLEYSDEGDYGISGRLVWLPYYDAATNGRYLMHLGASYEFTGANTINSSNPAGADSKTFTVVPEVNAQTPVASATIPCDTYQLFGAEAAIMNGPLLVASEYLAAEVPKIGGPNIYIPSAYVEALYLLTGENHNYNLPGKFFQGVTPYEPFFATRGDDGCVCRGWGAWEIAGRASYVDLNQDGLKDGRVIDFTVGMNWYLTANCSAKFDFIYSELDKGGKTTWMDIFAERIEYHF